MALATSKRKFYKLLDNLSSPKLAEDSNSSKKPARPVKRTRMVGTSSSSATRPYQPLRSTTTVRILSSNFENNNKESRPEGRTGSYSPWSHEQFLTRLKTFADVKMWSPKPDVINEVAWARRGWVAVARDEVLCKSCNERLVIKLESDSNWVNEKDGNKEDKWWTAETEQKLVEKYESLIEEAHERTCLWKKAGCKDDIYRISFSEPNVWVKSLCQRYNSLNSLSNVLPENIILPAVTEDEDREPFEPESMKSWFEEVLKTQIPKDNSSKSSVETQSSGDTPISTTAFVLALCGWEGQDQSGVKIATCNECFSRIGLWMYAKGGELKLDPVALHRAHCPWQNATSQNGLGRFEGLAGWEVLNEVICANVHRVKRQKGLSTMADEEVDDEESPSRSRAELDDEDQVRESRLARLRKALTGRRTKSSFDMGSR